MFSLVDRRLYLCTPVRDDLETFVSATVAGGVDVVQLRDKRRPRDEQLAAGRLLSAICRDLGVPFIVNDDPTLALEVNADGVHVGQDDESVARCRAVLGDDAIVGLSTHARSEFDDALHQRATYFSAGPLVPTPTKEGRPGTGLAYALDCHTRSDRPVFVTGGVDATNVTSLVRAGLRHFVVVRALTESSTPRESAASIRRALDEALSAVPIEPAQ